jgi:hypothetical protein
MNELIKAVIVFALATAVAVWLMGVALHLWPSADQLAYGNPLPYLKVKFDRPANAVRFWVEDFANVPYERVWLYVNGRLAASGGPGTDAVAKCGDEVAAVVKYHSGTKKLEGRILCTEPVRAPGGREVRRAIRLTQVTQAYRAMTGDMDQTGPPLRFDGSCDIDVYRNGYASVTIATLRPDVIFCVGVHCGTSYTLSWSFQRPGSARQIVPIHVFKAPDAPASQLLGGGRGVIDIYVEYDYVSYYDRYDLYVYVNGTLVAECHRETSVSRELASWTEYKEPNATGVYLARFNTWLPDGTFMVFDGNIVVYKRNDGTFGYRLILNPVEDPTLDDLNINLPASFLLLDSPSGAAYMGIFTYQYSVQSDATMLEFFVYLNTHPDFRETFVRMLDQMTDNEYNVPYIVVNKTGEYLVYHEIYSRQSRSGTFGFKTLSISSLGAVYANAVLPIDIRLPPPVPPQNGTRTYIFGYR